MVAVRRLMAHGLGLLCLSITVNIQAQTFGYPEVVSKQDDTRLEEVSGLAAAHSQPDYFWAINDGGNGPSLMLLDEDGQYKDQVELSMLGNHDWEDLDTFRYAGQNYIAIADIGDNYARRKVYYVHLVPEPTITPQGDIGPLSTKTIQTIAFQYEDGPRDAEALGIDLENRRILLLTKRNTPPRMYSLPLIMEPKRYVYRASHLANVPQLGQMSLSGGYLSQTLYAGLPTAMTVLQSQKAGHVHGAPSLTSLAVLSYGSVWLFDLLNETPASLREVVSIQLPAMPQAEALAVDALGGLTVMSEVTGSHIVRIPKML